MSQPRSGESRSRWWATALALLLFGFHAGTGRADEQTERRLLTGLKLFPALVAADQELATKQGSDGKLLLVLLYRDDQETANDAARRLASTTVRELPVRVLTLPYARLDELRGNMPAAIFLAEWSPEDLPKVVAFGRDHHRLVFSPFKGDVAAGAQTGIFITDRILPLVNKQALLDAGVRLKPFLLEVARTHE